MTICILPPEIINEILSRLPVKSLMKFRSVSKSWLALISSPQFINTHLSLSANNKEDAHHVLIYDFGSDLRKWKECPLKSLLHDSVTEALDLDYPMDDKDNRRLGVMGSCNGLVYLANSYLQHSHSLIWNPTTRKHKNLPPFRPRWEKHEPEFGFGYDDLHDDYKIVIISYNYSVRGSDDIEVKVYSLKSDSWTSVDYCDETFFINKSAGYGERLSGEGVFVDGKLHWSTCLSKGMTIIAFDLANEKWEKVEKPSSYVEGESELYFRILGSDLSVFTDYKETHISAWVMKEYGVKESWIKMFTIRYPNDPGWFPFHFMSNKGEILSVYGTTCMIYNSKDDSFRYSDITNCNKGEYSTLYLESLVSPSSTEGTEDAAKDSRKKLILKQSSNK